MILANDAHNRKPHAVPAKTRRKRLEALGVADEVLIGEAGSFVETLKRVSPEIIVLGFDQRLPDAATEAYVEKIGIEVVTLPWTSGDEFKFEASA